MVKSNDILCNLFSVFYGSVLLPMHKKILVFAFLLAFCGGLFAAEVPSSWVTLQNASSQPVFLFDQYYNSSFLLPPNSSIYMPCNNLEGESPSLMVWLYFGEQYLGTQIFQQPLILFSEGGFFQQAGEFPPQDTGMSLMLDGFAYGLAAWVASLGGAMMISFVYRFGTIAAT